MEYPPPHSLLFFLVVTTMPTTATAVALTVGVRLRRRIIAVAATVVITTAVRIRRGIATAARIIRIRRACGGITTADISASVTANVLRIAKQRAQPTAPKVATATRITGVLSTTRITYIAHNFLRPSCVFEITLIVQYMINAYRLVTAGVAFFLDYSHSIVPEGFGVRS